MCRDEVSARIFDVLPSNAEYYHGASKRLRYHYGVANSATMPLRCLRTVAADAATVLIWL